MHYILPEIIVVVELKVLLAANPGNKKHSLININKFGCTILLFSIPFIFSKIYISEHIFETIKIFIFQMTIMLRN